MTETTESNWPDPDTAVMRSEDFLSTPLDADNLEVLLAAKPPRRKIPMVRLLLAVTALIGVGIICGVEVQKEWGTSSGSGTGFPALSSAALGGGASSGSTLTGASGRGSSSASSLLGGATAGTVTLVDGSTVYVTTSDGIVKVVTNSSTSIQISKKSSLSDLSPGETVTVLGQKNSKGSLVATSVSEGSSTFGVGAAGTAPTGFGSSSTGRKSTEKTKNASG
jgi:hypothetical protein